MASVLDSIVSTAKARAEALGITAGGVLVTVERRTELVLLETDTKPIILLKASGPESSEPFATPDDAAPLGYVRAAYAVEMCLLSPQNADPTANEAELLQGRQRLRRAFQAQRWPEVPEVVSVRVQSPQGPGPGAQGFREGLRPDTLRLIIGCVEPTTDD